RARRRGAALGGRPTAGATRRRPRPAARPRPSAGCRSVRCGARSRSTRSRRGARGRAAGRVRCRSRSRGRLPPGSSSRMTRRGGVRAPGRQPTMPSAPLTTRNATSAPSSTTATPVATSRTVRGRTRTRSPGERGWALHRLARPWVAGASVGGNTRRARTDEHGGDDAAGREAEMVHVAEDGTIAYGSPDFDWSILTVPTALAVVRGQLGFSWLEVSDRLATLTQAELEWEPGPDALRVVRRGTERAPRTLGVGEWVME